MSVPSKGDQEAADARKVDQALELLMAGNHKKAERLLLEVTENTPDDYQVVEEDAEGFDIKFWDQASFMHYIAWMQAGHIPETSINWLPSAYPRAHYYLSFLYVKLKQYDSAWDHITIAEKLEPTKPAIQFEGAQILVHQKKLDEALARYRKVSDLGPFVSQRDLAVARRGEGFVLIEMQELDAAESAFKKSLEFEPNNEIAMGELQYIQHLRSGGEAARMESVASQSEIDMTKCIVCETHVEEGVVIQVKGIPLAICQTCHDKMLQETAAKEKKWWQFWK